MITGADIRPGVVEAAAGTLDLPPTILSLAGLPRLPAASEWEGTSLLELETERPLYLYQCAEDRARATVGMLHGSRKLISSYTQLENGELGRAFDLAVDPHELENLSDGSAPWLRELFDALRPQAEQFAQPRYEAGATQLDAEQEAALRALGYAGD